jgi:NADH:ubiquinone oxidoreductase subunit C
LLRLALYLRFSAVFYRTWLVDIGAYELRLGLWAGAAAPATLWHLFRSPSGAPLLVLSVAGRRRESPSVEHLFRNARWLEREVSEMHGWRFTAKRDRRSLFLSPLLSWAPLRKSFPTGGFYEARLDPLTSRVTFAHVSWAD